MFNFAIPAELHVVLQRNYSYQAIPGKYSMPSAGAPYFNPIPLDHPGVDIRLRFIPPSMG